MIYLADLHIHSPFSRATSKASNLAGLFAWARIKGIHLIGTGDFTHPGWLRELKENLAPAETGFFKLKDENIPDPLGISPDPISVRFVLTAEISSIYKRHGKVRKVHNILMAPDFESVERVNAKLAAIGNIESDGRPILGLDSRDLLEIFLEQAPEGFLVPAHIWTPWFSLFGSKSGFDAIEDCFGDLSNHIFALETGLSSDPEMNRLVSALDRFTLISNSDCHSPSKLGREANMFDTGYDFFSMRDALKNSRSGGFLGTIEFYPEEGKYHFDGHRKCGVCFDPQETRAAKSVCPVCGRPLTIGVTHRVMELADRPEPFYPENSPKFTSLIPLPEVLGEICGRGPATKGVMAQYTKVIERFGSEFNFFLRANIEDINQLLSPVLGEAVRRIRANKVIRNPGYDGEFGVIRVFEEGERDEFAGQMSLFGGRPARKKKKKPQTDRLPFPKKKKSSPAAWASLKNCNAEQKKAVRSTAKRILVTAGPGTGKTYTLIARLVRLLEEEKTPANQFVAITFTNRAADEVRERLTAQVGPPKADEVFVGTFHAFCLYWLRRGRPGLAVAGEAERDIIIANLFPELDRAGVKVLKKELLDYFNELAAGKDALRPAASFRVREYCAELDRRDGVDLDAVIPCFVRKLVDEPHFREVVCVHVSFLFVDEFQDINASQYELVKILGEKAQVFAIGDPDQAIYGFRGSDLNFFFQFAELPDTQTIALSGNYRSGGEILKAAAAVIRNNRQQSGIALKPLSDRDAVVEKYAAPTPSAEAEFVIRRIEEFMGGISSFSINSGRGGDSGGRERSFADIAVFYRLSRQAVDLREALVRRGIPFQLVGGRPFYMQPELRPVYFWLQCAGDQATVAEFLGMLKGVKGIGAITLKRLEQELPFGHRDYFSLAGEMNFQKAAHNKIQETAKSMDRFRSTCTKEGIAVALQDVFSCLGVDGGLPASKRFLELAGVFGGDSAGFALHLKQNAAATSYDERAEAVALMTLHAAKGLEFPVVFITGLEEGFLPYYEFDREYDEEEERRLFYVGVTRAQESLVFTSSETRTVFGKTEKRKLSRFVSEIPSYLITKREEKKKTRKKSAAAQLKLF